MLSGLERLILHFSRKRKYSGYIYIDKENYTVSQNRRLMARIKLIWNIYPSGSLDK